MTLREINLRVFQRQPVPRVFFQPRMESWLALQGARGGLPGFCRNRTLPALCEALGASTRYFYGFTGLADPVEFHRGPGVRMRETVEGEWKTTVLETPFGDLVEKRRMTGDGIWRKVEFAVRDADDLAKLRWVFERSEYGFNREAFRRGIEYQGDRGCAQFWICPSPYEQLTQDWMRFEDFIYALEDIPGAMSDVMSAVDRSCEPLFDAVAANPDVSIVNFPENIHVDRAPPAFFERYLVPWYHKRSEPLRRRGIFTHIHVDGNFRPLLKYLKDLPFDGFEALTPLPQGDVTLQEMREHIGGKILLDGIPAVLFLSHHSRDELQACVENLVRLFHPRLVLGVSDEFPQGGNEESFDRLRWVAEYCRRS